jgi:hypothetical protein
MEKYLGVKVINAESATKYDYEMNIKGVDCKEDNQEGYIVIYEDGYVSWSPKDVFEKAYRRIDNLTFGLAVEALKKGNKVARKGWNGKGMFLIGIGLPGCEDWNMPGERSALHNGIELMPWIGMKTADEKFVPWLASQTDMLAEDWCIIE